MHISRVKISNFANFQSLEVETAEDMVIVGENKVGKSNFLRAIQLILDPSLSERDRRLGLEHFWDGLGEHKLGNVVEISIELTEPDEDPRLLFYLADHIVSVGPPLVARLTYRYRPKPGLGRPPASLADYEYIIFGGDDPDNGYGSELRRRIPMDVQSALRDAEKDLASWRHSPLRPLIEGLSTTLDEDARTEILDQIDAAQTALTDRPEIEAAADGINDRLIRMVGRQHAVPLSLGLAPTRLDALLRGLKLLIDGGARSISDASLGSANLIFLSLKSLELDRLVNEGERDHTFFAVEEPEAHLHPHVQRLVYRDFLARHERDVEQEEPRNQTTILTTHSPHIASIAPLRSIVLLRKSGQATTAASTFRAPLSRPEIADLQRYVDVTRGELFFARRIILVEGDSERFLVPAFADALDISLDALGISVCSVSGTNFAPFVKLLGRHGLNIPYVVLTDRDAVPDKPPLALNRVRGLMKIIEPKVDWLNSPERAVFTRAARQGIFVNGDTLEPVLFAVGLGAKMQRVILQELSLTAATKTELQSWVDDPDILDSEHLLRLVERVGKGRFAQALAPHVSAETCPGYIRRALERIIDGLA